MHKKLFRVLLFLALPGLQAFLLGTLLLDRYTFLRSFQEDQWQNWLSAGLWIAAALAFAKKSIPYWRTRQFAAGLLLVLLCLFCSLEEINWGERLLGITAPHQVSDAIGTSHFSIHYFLHLKLGLAAEILLGALLLCYSLGLPLALRLDALREPVRPYHPFIPIPYVSLWVLLAGVLAASNIAGIGKEYAELLLAVAFFLVSITPTSISAPGKLDFDLLPSCSLASGVILLTAMFGLEYANSVADRRLTPVIQLIKKAYKDQDADTALALLRHYKPDRALLERHGLLSSAIGFSLPEVAEELLAEGMEVRHNPSIVIAAVRGEYPQLLREILQRGANPNRRDILGRLPLVEAVRRQNEEVISILLAYGADPNLPDGKGQTAEQLAKTIDGSLAVSISAHAKHFAK